MALHYLDDSLLLGPPGSPHCSHSLAATLALCAELGFPVAPEKTEGPCTTLTFPGIEIDTVAGQVRLPRDKLARLEATIAQWMSGTSTPSPKASGKKQDLLSLISLLSHAATVVRPGRPFLRSLIDAATSSQELDHWVHLNAIARADLRWWHTFLTVWNGVCVFPPSSKPLIVVSVLRDMGLWGHPLKSLVPG